jgi:hypothetical protein
VFVDISVGWNVELMEREMKAGLVHYEDGLGKVSEGSDNQKDSTGLSTFFGVVLFEILSVSKLMVREFDRLP